jgi:hypothetical protein
MKKVILSAITILFLGYFAQAQTTKPVGETKIDLSGRAADHLVFQFGSDALMSRPDSVKTSGFSRHFNVYFMYDKPFKKNQHYSVAFGAGLGTSNIFLDDHTYANLKTSASTLPFQHLDSTANHFAKQKLTTIYLQAPVELRYYSDPAHPGKSWKAAASIYGKTFIEKQEDTRFFNSTDVTLTGRVGYGIFSFDMGYTPTGYLRDGYGAVMNKVSFGITISGL